MQDIVVKVIHGICGFNYSGKAEHSGAVVKASEVALELAIPKDVTICFFKTDALSHGGKDDE